MASKLYVFGLNLLGDGALLQRYFASVEVPLTECFPDFVGQFELSLVP